MDGPEGQWWDVLPVGGASVSVAGYLFCMARRVAQCKNIHRLPGGGDGFACLVRVLKRARLED